jgi:uncharacterized RDD family membrane protein YckC
MSESSVPTAGQPQARTPGLPAETTNVAYAGFWIRVVAWLIDGVAIGILTSAMTPLLGSRAMVAFDGSTFHVDAGANAFGALLGLAYFVGLWAWRGQTVGMMPFLRYVGLIISFAVLLLGVIWVAFDGRKQGWHDKLANTVVVRRR